HLFDRGLLNGISFSVTPWWRSGNNSSTFTQAPVTVNGAIQRDAGGNILYLPSLASNQRIERAHGVELRLDKVRPSGISVQLSGTFQHVMTNYPAPGGEYVGGINPASVALGLLYPAVWASPFQSTLDISYRRAKWRVATQLYYDDGYPLIGAGLNQVIN